MPYSFIVAGLAVVAVFCVIGAVSSGKVKNAADYAVANRKAGALSVAGVIMGALVAGGSTIGTVQLAYERGLSAWWFTLGSGLGCALLGIRFAGPVRRSRLSTLPEFMERNYGYPTALLTLAGSILGTLLSMVTQFMAGTALLRSIYPVSLPAATLILSLLILAFIFMGGLKSFSAVSTAKIVVLHMLLALCCVKAAVMGQTPGLLARTLPLSPWFNPFANGFALNIGACTSLIVGVLCTQIYMQAVFAAADEETAKRGCLLAAVLIPPLGLMAIWVGLALRNAGVEVEAAQALPYFLNTYFHPALSGALWAGLAITIIGGASGLCLGIATNIALDIFPRISGKDKNDRVALLANRAAVFLAVAAAATLAMTMHSAYILHLSYIGMGLRAAGMAVPLIVAILRPGLLSRESAFVAAVAGLAAMMTTWLFVPRVEPLFVGLGFSILAAFVSHKLLRR